MSISPKSWGPVVVYLDTINSFVCSAYGQIWYLVMQYYVWKVFQIQTNANFRIYT